MGDIDFGQNAKCKGDVLLSLSLADPIFLRLGPGHFSDPSGVKLRCKTVLLLLKFFPVRGGEEEDSNLSLTCTTNFILDMWHSELKLAFFIIKHLSVVVVQHFKPRYCRVSVKLGPGKSYSINQSINFI